MPRAIDVTDADGAVVRRRPTSGDLRWDGRVWTRWDGGRWSKAAYSLSAAHLVQRTPLDQHPRLGEDRRRRALDLAVEDAILSRGAALVLQRPTSVVLGYRRPVSHLLHALATVITGGLWAVVWIVMTIDRREDRVRLKVDDWGHVWPEPVGVA